MKFLSVLFFMSVLCLCLASEGMVGAYSEPNLGLLADVHFLDVKTYILNEHPQLESAQITKVTTQVVAGTNYKVHFKTLDNKEYQVVVFDQPWTHHRSITSFHQIGNATQ